MKILSRRDFANMNLSEVAEFHEMLMIDFIREVYPSGKFTSGSEMFYTAYVNWCATQTPLGQLL